MVVYVLLLFCFIHSFVHMRACTCGTDKTIYWQIDNLAHYNQPCHQYYSLFFIHARHSFRDFFGCLNLQCILSSDFPFLLIRSDKGLFKCVVCERMCE